MMVKASIYRKITLDICRMLVMNITSSSMQKNTLELANQAQNGNALSMP
jgi:hypothetical protein